MTSHFLQCQWLHFLRDGHHNIPIVYLVFSGLSFESFGWYSASAIKDVLKRQPPFTGSKPGGSGTLDIHEHKDGSRQSSPTKSQSRKARKARSQQTPRGSRTPSDDPTAHFTDAETLLGSDESRPTSGEGGHKPFWACPDPKQPPVHNFHPASGEHTYFSENPIGSQQAPPFLPSTSEHNILQAERQDSRSADSAQSVNPVSPAKSSSSQLDGHELADIKSWDGAPSEEDFVLLQTLPSGNLICRLSDEYLEDFGRSRARLRYRHG